MFHVPSGGELILLVLVIVLLFGAKRIPEIMRGLGQGIREFKSATHEAGQELHKAATEEPAPAAAPPVEATAVPPPVGATSVPPPAAVGTIPAPETPPSEQKPV